MAEEKNIQSKRRINNKLLAVIAIAIIAVTAVIIISLTLPRSVKAKELEKQLDLGDKYISELKYEQAVAAYLAAIEIDPKCEEAYFALVDAYVAMGEYDKAEEVLREAESELGEAAVKEKKAWFDNKLGSAFMENETTTVEPEINISESETTTVESEMNILNNPNVQQIFVKIAEDEEYISISLEAEKFPIWKYNFMVTLFGEGVTKGGIRVGNSGQTSMTLTKQEASKCICILKKEYFSNIHNVNSISISVSGDNVELVQTTDATYSKGVNVTDNVTKMIYVWDGTFEKGDIVGIEDKYEYCKEIYVTFGSGPNINNEVFAYGLSAFTDGIILTKLLDETQAKLVIPETIDGKRVIAIDNGFCKYNDNVTEIEMPDSIKWIGGEAFKYCDNLSNIRFSDNLEFIGEDEFYGSSLKSLDLPDSLLWIGDGAFYNSIATEYSGLREKLVINIPKNVAMIGESAFSRNENIKGFIVDEDNENFVVSDNVLYTRDYETLLAAPEALAFSDYKVKEGCRKIGNSAFAFCDSLEYIYFPDTLYEIGVEAFYGCDMLNNVTLPEGLNRIGGRAFAFCDSLESISIPSTVSIIGYEAFGVNNIGSSEDTKWLKNKKENASYVEVNGILIWASDDIKGDIVIPEGITAIGDSVFAGNENITSVTFPEEVVRIGNSAFHGCSLLENITILGEKIDIGNFAFGWCELLKNISISGEKVSIGDWVFVDCKSLDEVVLHGGIVNIGEYVFYQGCDSLENVTISGETIGIGESAFGAALKRISISGKKVSIGKWAFSRCGSLEKAIIPGSLRYISPHAFPSWGDILDKLTIVTSAESPMEIYAKERGIKVVNQ